MAKSKEKQNEKPKRGCLLQSLFLVSAISSLLLAVAVVVMLLPQDLSNIEGYGPGAQSEEVRDLNQVIKQSLERGHQVTLSEEEINRWIGQTLKIEQAGLLGGVVKINGLGVRLGEDEAEIVIERSFLGLKSTQSMFIQVIIETSDTTNSKEILLHGGPIAKFFPALKRGGRFGCLTVPQGYLHLVKPAFFQLGEVYKDELEMMFRKMQDIRIEKDQLVLTPRQAVPAAPSP